MCDKLTEIKEKIYNKIDKKLDKNLSVKELKEIALVVSTTSMIQEVNLGKIFEFFKKDMDKLEENKKCRKK